MSVFTISNPKIKELVSLSSELKDLSSTMELLSWDQETYITPRGAITRARQLETLSGIYHEHATAKKIGQLLNELSENLDNSSLNDFDRSLIKEMKREYLLATKLPAKLVRELSKESSLGLESWRHARAQNDFSLYAPALSKMIALKREVAETLGYQDSPYDALLDEFEEGLTKAQIHKVFATLKPKLEILIPKLTDKTTKFNHGLFLQEFDRDKLWELSLTLLTKIGFDLERGRQDESTHPFTMGLSSDDVRLTTRVLTNNPISTLLSSVHEGGHGMYEQGISPEIEHTTIGLVNSLVAHESQSRFWENMIGKSQDFWDFFFPEFQNSFPDQLENSSSREVWEEVNIVRPSLIRVDADEISYHMHIIIRTEIESELIEGKLKISDVPERWNSAFKQYLGIAPNNDKEGVLQDIHWSQGLIGYFPTYSLGSLMSAQLFQTLKKQKPNLSNDIKAGKFEIPLHWLNENIHQHGRIYTSNDLCKRITGKELSPDDFLTTLSQKFDLS